MAFVVVGPAVAVVIVVAALVAAASEHTYCSASAPFAGDLAASVAASFDHQP